MSREEFFYKLTNILGGICDSGEQLALVTFGPPAAGKSTFMSFLKKQVTTMFDKEPQGFVSADEIKKTLPGYDPKNSTPVYQDSVRIAEQQVKDLSDQQKSVFFDTGSINSSYTKRILSDLRQKGYKIALLTFTPSVEDCILRNEVREVPVPEEVIREKVSRAPEALIKILPLVDVVIPVPDIDFGKE